MPYLSRRRLSGRINFVLLGALACIALVATLFLLMRQESIAAVGVRFMSALAKGDAQTLARMSHLEGKSSEQVLQDWQRTMKHSKHFPFRWTVLGADQSGPDSGSVRLEVEQGGAGYANKFSLPLRRIGGEWKVEVRGINREMYPYLPK